MGGDEELEMKGRLEIFGISTSALRSLASPRKHYNMKQAQTIEEFDVCAIDESQGRLDCVMDS
jgi:hypothetical protein